MWIAKITKPRPDGKHIFSAVNSISGETLTGQVGAYPPSFQVLPSAFFDAIRRCVDEYNSSVNEMKIEPDDIVQIETTKLSHPDDSDLLHEKWDDITENVSAKIKLSTKTDRWRPYLGSNLYNESND